jgi:hypothetical protein
MCLRLCCWSCQRAGVASVLELPASTTDATMHTRHRRGQMVGLLVLFSEPNVCVDVDTLDIFLNTLIIFQHKLTDFLLYNNECSL